MTTSYTLRMTVESIEQLRNGKIIRLRKENLGILDSKLIIGEIDMPTIYVGDEVEVTIEWQK